MKYTIVTGATSDIGRQICVTLEKSGHNLLLTDLSSEVLEESLKGLSFPERHKILPLDFSDVEGAKAIMQDYIKSNQIQVAFAVFAASIISSSVTQSIIPPDSSLAASAFVQLAGLPIRIAVAIVSG